MYYIVATAANWIPFSKRAKIHSIPAQFGKIPVLQQIFLNTMITLEVFIYHFCMFSLQSLLGKQYSLRWWNCTNNYSVILLPSATLLPPGFETGETETKPDTSSQPTWFLQAA